MSRELGVNVFTTLGTQKINLHGKRGQTHFPSAANGAIATLNLSNAAMTESTGYNARFQPLTIQDRRGQPE